MKKIAFIFHTFPHTTASGREGLDALLAASAYTEDISVFFIGDGVTQLIKEQIPSNNLNRDYISAFKLMDLYDIEKIYMCQTSMDKFGLEQSSLIIDVERLTLNEVSEKIGQCDQLLTF